jgi:8-oxo-dGTP pyrophosphatase MutT (NUDIX family)
MAACVLVRSEDGKILVVSRKDDPYDFGLPGGKVDEGETAEEGAARELEEETGLRVTGLRQVYSRYDGSHCCHVFMGNVEGDVDTDETGVIRWVEPHVLLTQSRFAAFNRRLFDHLKIRTDQQEVTVEERVVRLSSDQLRSIINEEVGGNVSVRPLSAYAALEMVHKDNGYLSTPSRLLSLLERLEKEQFDAGYDAGLAAAERAQEV